MHGHLREVKALERLVGEHVSHQVFEMITKCIADFLFMNLPKLQLIVATDILIALIIDRCLDKRFIARLQDKDDDPKSENIRHSGLVNHLGHDFG